MAYAHNGSDAVVLSPSGAKVLAFDTLNPPFVLAVARLDETGPTLALLCRFTTESNRVRVTELFGWRGRMPSRCSLRPRQPRLMRQRSFRARRDDRDHWQCSVRRVGSAELPGSVVRSSA